MASYLFFNPAKFCDDSEFVAPRLKSSKCCLANCNLLFVRLRDQRMSYDVAHPGNEVVTTACVLNTRSVQNVCLFGCFAAGQCSRFPFKPLKKFCKAENSQMRGKKRRYFKCFLGVSYQDQSLKKPVSCVCEVSDDSLLARRWPKHDFENGFYELIT